MPELFGDDYLPRTPNEIAPGAWHVPGWLSTTSQQWIAERFREWASGPVPLRAAKVGGHEMSVKTVCLGWHWRPYQYTRDAVDVNGNRVLDFPEWMVRLGRQALVATGFGWGESGGSDESGTDYTPDTALANYYDAAAKMGMHQDKDEKSRRPVVSLSIGDTCVFRFGNTAGRGKPYRDVRLVSGDLFVFGGPSRMAYHGVTKVFEDTSPADCGVGHGRINITMRETGFGG